MKTPLDAELKLDAFCQEGVLSIQNGFACGDWNDEERGTLHIRPFNITSLGRVDLSATKYIQTERDVGPYLLRKRDVIFNNTNSEELVGKAALWDGRQEAVVSNHMTIMRVADQTRVSPEFLAFYLNKRWFDRYFHSICRRHVNQASISTERLRDTDFPPFNVSEQRKIAGVLGVVQRAIAQQERLLMLTAELKKALLHQLFTRGLRGEPQKQTDLGPIPESWEARRLGDYARVLNGYAFKSDDYVEEGVRLIRIGNVGIGTLLAKDDKYLPRAYLAEKAEYALEEGDLILALTRPIIAGGIKFCFVRRSDLPALLNQRVGKFQVTSPKLLKDYLSHVLFSDYFIKPLKTMAEGSNQPNISPTRLENFLIPVPTDLKEQAEIDEVLTNLTNSAEIARRKHAILSDLFRTLLHQFMTGQLRVHDLDLTDLDVDAENPELWAGNGGRR